MRALWRRVAAVVVGLVVCQLSMLVCLALALLAVVQLGHQPVLALTIVALLLFVPGLAGGAFAGGLTDRAGAIYGVLTTLGFGVILLLVRLFVAPRYGYFDDTDGWSNLLFVILVGQLGLCGHVGGSLGAWAVRYGRQLGGR